ncbi:hypothetical protein EDC01DRAFT_226412 [Geopyxis carbonaria]|nr:hypothetical protein EDC01DRAFT_226412 [Geopyxis carbonaria]
MHAMAHIYVVQPTRRAYHIIHNYIYRIPTSHPRPNPTPQSLSHGQCTIRVSTACGANGSRVSGNAAERRACFGAFAQLYVVNGMCNPRPASSQCPFSAAGCSCLRGCSGCVEYVGMVLHSAAWETCGVDDSSMWVGNRGGFGGVGWEVQPRCTRGVVTATARIGRPAGGRAGRASGWGLAGGGAKAWGKFKNVFESVERNWPNLGEHSDSL